MDLTDRQHGIYENTRSILERRFPVPIPRRARINKDPVPLPRRPPHSQVPVPLPRRTRVNYTYQQRNEEDDHPYELPVLFKPHTFLDDSHLGGWSINNDNFVNDDYFTYNDSLEQEVSAYDQDGPSNASFARNDRFNRSFSQPPTATYPYIPSDMNEVIHRETMSNPWGTVGRKSDRRRNRYAMYFSSEEGDLEQLGRCYDNECFGTTPKSLNADVYKARRNNSDIYGTYPRAPRNNSRTDVQTLHNTLLDRSDAFRIRTDLNQNSAVRKVPKVHYCGKKDNIVDGQSSTKTNKEVDIRHLFSIQLQDVQMNTENGIDNESDSPDKTTENLPQPGGLCKGKRKRRTSTETEEKTFFLCRWISTYPKTAFLLTLGGHLLIALVTAVLLFTGSDVFPTEFETMPLYDWEVPWLKRSLAWTFRNEYDDKYIRKWFLQSINKWFRSMAYDRANIVLYFDTGGKENIFTQKNLKTIEQIEHKIFNMANYTEFCVQEFVNLKFNCQKPTSVLRYFDGTFAGIDPVFNDTKYDNIAKVLYAARNNNKTKGDFAYFLAENNHVTPDNVFAPVTRSIFPMGFPLSLKDKLEEMEDKMEEFLVKSFEPAVHDVKESIEGFKIIHWSYILFRHDIVRQIFVDLLLATMSGVFIFCFMIFHTKSLWISTFGTSSILTCFLCTNLIYRYVFDYRYFGYFHVVTLFIILGIGADDIFVFLDVWKNTSYQQFSSLDLRLTSAYKCSIKSMFITSFTTMVAFFGSAFTPLLATQSFGVFAGVLVIINYISVVTFFPTVVITHHLYFEKWKWPCLSKGIVCALTRACASPVSNASLTKPPSQLKPQHNFEELFTDNSAIGSTGKPYNVIGRINSAFRSEVDDEYGFVRFKNGQPSTARPNAHTSDQLTSSNTQQESITSITSAQSSGLKEEHRRKVLVRFFSGHYFQFVTHWLARWIILLVLLTAVVFFSYCTSLLTSDNEQVQFYRSSHNYGKALNHDFHSFVPNKNDRNVVVIVAWGLRERDMSACHFSDSDCIGQQRVDDTFNPNSLEAQIALRDFCNKLHDFSHEDIERFKIRRDFSTGEPEIKCFARDLDLFLAAESTVSGANLTLPWTYRKSMKFMESHSLTYNTLKFNTSFPDVLEIPIAYWLNDRYLFKNKSSFNKFHDLIGERIGPYSSPLKTDFSEFYGNRLVYFGVQVNLTLGRFSSGYVEGKPVMDRWESFVQKEMAAMPPGLQNGFQLTKDYWHSLAVQKSLKDSAIFGIVLGIILALPILTIATENFIVGFVATFCMCCSTVCVVGIIPLIGWKLGVLEALNMCMVVGLTVDYVVHLAEGYHLSKRLDRKSRVQDMLEVMGLSVFSGACTTLGACVFMFFAQIQFMVRFGIFMFSTIGFSLIFSLGLFPTLMGMIGPDGDTGNIKAIYRKLIRRCS